MDYQKDNETRQLAAEVNINLNLPPISFYREGLAPIQSPSFAVPKLRSGMAWGNKIEEAFDALRNATLVRDECVRHAGAYFNRRREHVEH